MKDNQKYSTQDFDIEALAASLKLLLSRGEAEGFLADIADMANYIHSNLPDESAESALALCNMLSKELSELREDVCATSRSTEILSSSHSTDGRYVCVPTTVGGAE